MDPQLLGLRTVIYPSPDLDAAKRWWTDFLGVAPYFDQPFYVGFDVAGYELGLVPDGDLSREATTYWGVGDVATCVERATARGAEVLERLTTSVTVSSSARCATPRGAWSASSSTPTSPRGTESPVTPD
jgi:catechol 2,3-dioxygenase-like lactoylglutathione lyase family enzyme